MAFDRPSRARGETPEIAAIATYQPTIRWQIGLLAPTEARFAFVNPDHEMPGIGSGNCARACTRAASRVEYQWTTVTAHDAVELFEARPLKRANRSAVSRPRMARHDDVEIAMDVLLVRPD